MNYRTRIYYSEAQKEQMWDRWQRGESLKSIGRAFNRGSSSIYGVLSRSGGIRPLCAHAHDSRFPYLNVKKFHVVSQVIYGYVLLLRS